jgi:Uma2 family endonuclease
MASPPKQKYTLDQYLELERKSEIRYEFWNGEIFAMSGGSFAHDIVTGNVDRILAGQIEGKNCRVVTSNMQIKVPSAPPYRYADGSIVCGTAEIERYNGSELLVNPIIIWEVLSPSTEAYDRGDKFTFYKSIASFKEYILIAQHRPHVSHYVKQSTDSWNQVEYNDLNDVVSLRSVDCMLALANVYDGITFENQGNKLSGPLNVQDTI